MKYDRVFVVVIDSLKIGSLGDNIINSLDNISDKMFSTYGEFNIPNLRKLGLANIHERFGDTYIEENNINSTRKQKICTHWDMLRKSVSPPFRVFDSLPNDLISELERNFGKNIAVGKQNNLNPISYRESNFNEVILLSSNDSTIQICGNEELMELETLYRYCEIAREVTLKDEWRVKKIIATPYVINKSGDCIFTANKREYDSPQKELTYLDGLKSYGYDVIAVGKVDEILRTKGVTSSNPSINPSHGMEKTIEIASSNFRGLCFTNLSGLNEQLSQDSDEVDFGKQLELFDIKLGNLITVLNFNDLLIITANHSNDIEVVPMISYSKKMGSRCTCDLIQFENISTISSTIADNFGINTNF